MILILECVRNGSSSDGGKMMMMMNSNMIVKCSNGLRNVITFQLKDGKSYNE